MQTMPDAELLCAHQVETEYSDFPLNIGEVQINNCRFFFLGRHGAEQQIPPHLINYRANISALSKLGVKSILAVTAVGGIRSDLGVGDLLIPDQIIDYTWGRESTFFDGLTEAGIRQGGRRHIDFTYPYSHILRDSLLKAGGLVTNRKVHDGGVYACTQGPRLETAAEVVRLKSDGADVVGMTGMPEAALARELELDYASLSLVVNPAAGLAELELSEQEIEEECRSAFSDISQLLVSAVSSLQN